MGLPKNGFFGYDGKDGEEIMMILKYGFGALALAAMFAVLPLGNQSCAQGAAGAGAGGANSGAAGGAGIAPQTCDTQVWQTMEMRSRMETEREIMQNQNLIFKPDSILAYTCFDKFAEHAAQYGGVIFTHTTYWDGKEIIPWGEPDGMDYSMKQVVLKSMKTYMDSNFPYSMLGDRGNDLGAGGGGGGGRGGLGAADGMGRYSTSQTGKGDYACNRMNAVWKAAKCMNFIHNENFQDIDGYYPFINLKGHDGGDDIKGYETINDTREYPPALKCTAENPVYQNSWLDAYRKSRNENSFGAMNKFYEFSIPLEKAYKDVRKKVEPGTCPTNGAILTGVTVIESEASGGGEYPDGVCTNPGCVYVKSGSNAGTCQAGGGGGGGGGATQGQGTGAAE